MWRCSSTARGVSILGNEECLPSQRDQGHQLQGPLVSQGCPVGRDVRTWWLNPGPETLLQEGWEGQECAMPESSLDADAAGLGP